MLNENLCGTVLGDRSLQWCIAMEQSIFRYFRGWELQTFCVELRAYKMWECHTASFLPACAWFAFPESCSNVIPSFNFGIMGHPRFLREDLVLKYCCLCSVWVCAVELMLIMELYWRMGTFSKKTPKPDLSICFSSIDWGQTISLVPRNHSTSHAASLACCSDKEHDVLQLPECRAMLLHHKQTFLMNQFRGVQWTTKGWIKSLWICLIMYPLLWMNAY